VLSVGGSVAGSMVLIIAGSMVLGVGGNHRQNTTVVVGATSRSSVVLSVGGRVDGRVDGSVVLNVDGSVVVSREVVVVEILYGRTGVTTADVVASEGSGNLVQGHEELVGCSRWVGEVVTRKHSQHGFLLVKDIGDQIVRHDIQCW
jgi:hypothetical protein